MSGNAFAVKSNGAISGRLIGPAFAMASTSLAESSVAISDGGSFFRMSTSVCTFAHEPVTAGLSSSPFGVESRGLELLQHLLDARVVAVRWRRLLCEQVDAVGLAAELVQHLRRHQRDRGECRDVVRRDLFVSECVEERHHLSREDQAERARLAFGDLGRDRSEVGRVGRDEERVQLHALPLRDLLGGPDEGARRAGVDRDHQGVLDAGGCRGRRAAHHERQG